MKILSLALPAIWIFRLVNAFAPDVRPRRRDMRLFSDENPSEEKVASLSKSPYEEGSHDELMYALGVNLARQLGDVRPLVETGEELASVAKGLLDSVIGRLEDEGQRELLGRRGKDLNKVIAERA